MADTVTDRRGRVLKIRELGPDDMLNLMETGGGAAGQESWMAYAMLISTVEAIDDEPAPPLGCPKPMFLAFAKKLGNDGIIAVNTHVFGSGKSPDQDVETAKN